MTGDGSNVQKETELTAAPGPRAALLGERLASPPASGRGAFQANGLQGNIWGCDGKVFVRISTFTTPRALVVAATTISYSTTNIYDHRRHFLVIAMVTSNESQ